jgi:hypothetical protein
MRMLQHRQHSCWIRSLQQSQALLLLLLQQRQSSPLSPQWRQLQQQRPRRQHGAR